MPKQLSLSIRNCEESSNEACQTTLKKYFLIFVLSDNCSDFEIKPFFGLLYAYMYMLCKLYYNASLTLSSHLLTQGYPRHANDTRQTESKL